MRILSSPAQVPFDERFLERSWTWLRDPELKRLTDTPDFTREAQRSWYDSLPRRTDYLVWGIRLGDEEVGAFGLKHVTSEDAEYWGYLGEKAYWGQGLGQWMLERASAEGRRLGLQRLRLRVLRENTRAIATYQRFGFQADSETARHFLMTRII